MADTSIPTVEVQTAEDPNDEPELEVLDDNAVKLDISNVPIILTISQVLLGYRRLDFLQVGIILLLSLHRTICFLSV